MTPAGKLVRAFGDPAAMAALYAEDVQWSLPASIRSFARPMRGRDAVTAFNREIWTRYYAPDCTVEILDEAGDERTSAVRFIYRAQSLIAGRAYENEYTVFVRSGPEGISEVNEALDTVAMLDFMLGRAVGDSLDMLAGN